MGEVDHFCAQNREFNISLGFSEIVHDDRIKKWKIDRLDFQGKFVCC